MRTVENRPRRSDCRGSSSGNNDNNNSNNNSNNNNNNNNINININNNNNQRKISPVSTSSCCTRTIGRITHYRHFTTRNRIT